MSKGDTTSNKSPRPSAAGSLQIPSPHPSNDDQQATITTHEQVSHTVSLPRGSPVLVLTRAQSRFLSLYDEMHVVTTILIVSVLAVLTLLKTIPKSHHYLLVISVTSLLLIVMITLWFAMPTLFFGKNDEKFNDRRRLHQYTNLCLSLIFYGVAFVLATPVHKGAYIAAILLFGGALLLALLNYLVSKPPRPTTQKDRTITIMNFLTEKNCLLHGLYITFLFSMSVFLLSLSPSETKVLLVFICVTVLCLVSLLVFVISALTNPFLKVFFHNVGIYFCNSIERFYTIIFLGVLAVAVYTTWKDIMKEKPDRRTPSSPRSWSCALMILFALTCLFYFSQSSKITRWQSRSSMIIEIVGIAILFLLLIKDAFFFSFFGKSACQPDFTSTILALLIFMCSTLNMFYVRAMLKLEKYHSDRGVCVGLI